ncbi:MAG: TetR/AcrR family transcriptional regulator, partial [Cyclobacteriaceae bacterium]
YMFPNSLASTAVLTAKQQLFFSLHLPSLSNIKKDSNMYEGINNFLEQLVFGQLSNTRDNA